MFGKKEKILLEICMYSTAVVGKVWKRYWEEGSFRKLILSPFLVGWVGGCYILWNGYFSFKLPISCKAVTDRYQSETFSKRYPLLIGRMYQQSTFKHLKTHKLFISNGYCRLKVSAFPMKQKTLCSLVGTKCLLAGGDKWAKKSEKWHR